MAAMRKISATILDFGTPLFDLIPPDAPIATQREALSIVILVWNAVIIDEAKGTSHLRDARKSLRTLPRAGRALFDKAFDQLVASKARDFRDDKRLVGNWELRVAPGGGASLWAEARELGAPSVASSVASSPPPAPIIKPRFR